MKNILIMGGVGVGLFSATVVGLLGAQGRLNYEGTRGVPLLSMFFAAPEEDPNAEADPHGEGGDDHATDGHDADGHTADAHDGHGDQDPHADGGHGDQGTHAPDEGYGVTHEGLGKEEPLDYAVGRSALNPEPAGGGGHGGGHGDDGHGDDGHGDDGHAGEQTDKPRKKLTPPADDFQRQMESMLGDAYRRGNFFKFPRFDADISVEQLNQYLHAAKTSLDALDRERAKLESYESELEARQRDIEDRERMVADQMAKVDQARTKLDARIREFEAQVLIVRRDEQPALEQYAATLANFEPNRAMQHVIQSWETEDGRDRILKVLAVMSPEAVDAILAEVELPQLKDILVQRLRVVVEKGAGAKK